MESEICTVISKDFEFAVQILRWTFKPLGVWPLLSRSYSFRLRIILFITVISLQMFGVIPGFLYIIFIERNLTFILKFLGPLSFSSTTAIKFSLLMINNRLFHAYLAHLAGDWYLTTKEKYRKIMMDKTVISRFLMLICIIAMLSSGLLYCTYLTLNIRPYVIRGNDTFYHLPLDGYFVFVDIYQKKYFNWAYAIQCMAAFTIYIIHAGICNLSILGILHISSQCSITNSMIRNLTKKFDDPALGKIIQHHWRSLKLAFKMQDLMNEIYLVELSSSTFHVCLVGYYLIVDFKNSDTSSLITYTMFFVSFTFNIFMFCYLGELLTEQFESVGTEVLMLNWYNLPIKGSRYFYLIILFTQRPVYLSAGKIINFSLPSFTQVMKASATYLNMLRTLTL